MIPLSSILGIIEMRILKSGLVGGLKILGYQKGIAKVRGISLNKRVKKNEL